MAGPRKLIYQNYVIILRSAPLQIFTLMKIRIFKLNKIPLNEKLDICIDYSKNYKIIGKCKYLILYICNISSIGECAAARTWVVV